MHRRIIVSFTAALCTVAALASFSCSESTDGAAPDRPLEPADASAGQDVTQGSNDASNSRDTSPVTESALVLNEVAAAAEWVELVSTGSGPLDVSGFKVADLAKDGGPKLDEAVTFPSGTILSPKAYVIVQGGGLDGGGKACPDGGQSYCFNAEFGISNKNGDTLYLLDKSGAVVGSATYPPFAADAGETWGRLPSGDPAGIFQKTAPTPGAANRAN